MKTLIIGSGGREHALSWKLNASYHLEGNGGTYPNIPISRFDFPAILHFIQKENIDFVVVGPEDVLALGIVDYLSPHCHIFGPTKEMTILESDKFFSYDVMTKLDIPQAYGIKCYNSSEATLAIQKLKNVVIKSRGLTGGKGVYVCNSCEEALAQKITGEVLISERLYGREFSVFGIADGRDVKAIPVAVQDYKKLLDGGKGPNTGGMGAMAPVPADIKWIEEKVMKPVVRHLSFKGLLYAGMMATEDGLRVLEFNVRFGDPECQALMMLLKNSLYDVLQGASAEIKPGASICVVLAQKGYPGKVKKVPISACIDNLQVFHAGTCLEDGQLMASGGRVLNICAYSPVGIEEARKKVYEGIAKIPGFHFRTDIGS